MNAAELRIGNIIFSKISGGLVVVQYIPLDIDMDNYGSVKLTEEWLLKAGFEHILNEHTNADFWQIKRKKNDYRPHITIYKNRITVGNNTGVKYFNDVHSLQNLYFALSGEELTIK